MTENPFDYPLFSELYDVQPQAISWHRPLKNEQGQVIDFEFAYCNDEALKYIELSRDQIIGLKVSTTPHLTEELRSRFLKEMIEVYESGQKAETTAYNPKLNKYSKVLRAKLRDGILSVVQERTEEYRAIAQLQESSQKLQAVIDTTVTGIVMGEPIMDEKGEIVDFRFTMINSVIASFTGKTKEELIGETGSRWFARYKTNGLFERLRDAYLSGEKQQFDFFYDGDMHQVWVNIMIGRIKNEMLCSVTDFTPEKRLRLELETMVEELKRSNASLEEFAYAASHDMKEPVRKVQYFTERLRLSIQDRLKDDELRMLERVESANDRIRQLIEDLLEYSHVSLKPKAKEEIDLNQKMKSVLTDLEIPIREKGAVVMIEPLPVIRGHRRQIQQVFQNLIGNSLKYSKEGVKPEIRISSRIVVPKEEGMEKVPETRDCDKFHLIQIKDNGIGFDSSQSERIFSMFTRLHGISEYKGTGVGLSIVRKVIDNHNGYIWAEGEEGKGATFSILFPV